MKRIGTLALCALLLAFMFLIPSYVDDQVGKDIYLQWMSGQRGWQGVLHIWHVSSWLTATGSDGSGWLAARAREFEKRHFGLFIEIQTMTPAAAANRLEAGESPDLWSFPAGFAPARGAASSGTFSSDRFTGEALVPFRAGELADAPGMLPNLMQSGRLKGEQLALPYMMSGYMLLWNTDLLDSREVTTPDSNADPPESWTAQSLAEAVKAATFVHKVGKQSTSYVGLCYASGHRIGLAGLIGRMPALAKGEYGAGEEYFLNGVSAFCAGTMGTMGALERLEAAGKGFSYAAEPAGSFTDCVQYIAVSAGLDEECERNAKEFALWLLREKGQKQLAQSGALSVTDAASAANLSPPDAYAPSVKALAQLLQKPLVPNAFAWSGQRTRLGELTDSVLSGDAAAIAKFRAVMLE